MEDGYALALSDLPLGSMMGGQCEYVNITDNMILY